MTPREHERTVPPMTQTHSAEDAQAEKAAQAEEAKAQALAGKIRGDLEQSARRLKEEIATRQTELEELETQLANLKLPKPGDVKPMPKPEAHPTGRGDEEKDKAPSVEKKSR